MKYPNTVLSEEDFPWLGQGQDENSWDEFDYRTCTVGQLVEILQKFDPNKEVYLKSHDYYHSIGWIELSEDMDEETKEWYIPDDSVLKIYIAGK